MLRATSLAKLVRQSCQFRLISHQTLTSPHSAAARSPIPSQINTNATDSLDNKFSNHAAAKFIRPIGGAASEFQVAENVSRKDKIKFLVDILIDLKDSKEAIYGTLDAWVAWERQFPIGPLKNVLLALEKEQQWHRIIQVIKWMLSKGQGTTMGTYQQLIRALDMDHRADEAHQFWRRKVGSDLHSVPWKLCTLMISVYYRNNMLPELVKLFKGLEAFDRKPPEKSVVQKVANAYEMLGFLEEKERVLEKYKDLFTEAREGRPKESNSSRSEKKKKSREKSVKKPYTANSSSEGTKI